MFSGVPSYSLPDAFPLTPRSRGDATDGGYLGCWSLSRPEIQVCPLLAGSKYKTKENNQLPDPLLNSEILLLVVGSLWTEHVLIETSHDVLFDLIHDLLNSFRRHWNIQMDIKAQRKGGRDKGRDVFTAFPVPMRQKADLLVMH